MVSLQRAGTTGPSRSVDPSASPGDDGASRVYPSRFGGAFCISSGSNGASCVFSSGSDGASSFSSSGSDDASCVFCDPTAIPVSPVWGSIAPSVSSPRYPAVPPVSSRQDPYFPCYLMAPLVSLPCDPITPHVSPPRDPAALLVSYLWGPAAPPVFPFFILVIPASAPAPAPGHRAAELHAEVLIVNTVAAGLFRPVDPLHHLPFCFHLQARLAGPPLVCRHDSH